MNPSALLRSCSALFFAMVLTLTASAQNAYFVDGYHGGVYGHYPSWKTKFIVDELIKNPNWAINLEIEPETWDSVKSYDPQAYAQFQNLLTDPATARRIEFVNPAYGQSYLYNISGESIIRQFELGIKKTNDHFPTATFLTYSSEEPCFTSALPQILNSFGFKYAVLKNPNTCWGGYTRAYGGEKVNWIGPDGSSIPTVPRYAVEALEPGSTWQTIAWVNSASYIQACLNAGIKHPVGMTLQDAGWRGGPWMGSDFTKNTKNIYQPSEYILWRDYFSKVSTTAPENSWRVSQEDILVSLVWGSQVLQRLAQQVRDAENKIVMSEKLAALHSIFSKDSYPASTFERAWSTLLLAQHHDCWIVPYNGKPGDTWADKTKTWTENTVQISDSIIAASLPQPLPDHNNLHDKHVYVFNTLGSERNEIVSLSVPGNKNLTVVDDRGQEIATQQVAGQHYKTTHLLFSAKVPSLGFAAYKLKEKSSSAAVPANKWTNRKDKSVILETDLYRITFDPSKGGVISSLKAKKLGNREFVDTKAERSFNELRGFFYKQNKFLSSTEKPASVKVLENGPLRTKIFINGLIGEHPFEQTITICQGSPVIDVALTIDWKENPGIGKYDQSKNYKAENLEKAFYDDRFKLLALFPANITAPRIYKDAPFDVTTSKLDNTFFERWDSIKNNVILNWVDLAENSGKYGMALLSDHTTSYAYANDHPLGLTVQYSGTGLWGRNYKITGPTKLRYALIPHAGKWDAAGISRIANEWKEPMVTMISSGDVKERSRSWARIPEGWEISSLQAADGYALLRIYNASRTSGEGNIVVDDPITNAELIELNGDIKENIPVKLANDTSTFVLSIPRFGFRTIRLKTGER